MRIGIILQALGAVITALVIAFVANWKLAFVNSCFIPMLMLSGIIQGQKQSAKKESDDEISFIEQGGQVFFLIISS
jgi:hypothetical protein